LHLLHINRAPKLAIALEFRFLAESFLVKPWLTPVSFLAA